MTCARGLGVPSRVSARDAPTKSKEEAGLLDLLASIGQETGIGAILHPRTERPGTKSHSASHV